MTTAQDLIKGALRRIVSYTTGESIAGADAQDCLDTLNDLLDSWSTDKLQIFGSNENVLQWVNGKAQYSIGNPTCTDLGNQPFVGTITSGSAVITGVTIVPSDLKVGSTLTDPGTAIPEGTKVITIGVNTVTMSAVATSTPVNNPTQITYTVPGDFAIARPLRITGGYTRINQLDFWLDVYASQAEYTSILFKAQAGPWPILGWYNPQMPYGLFNVYPTPSANAEVHIFSDTILSNLTMNQTVILPQGYARAIKWCLAQELAAEYGYPLTPALKKNAYESLQMIKALNAEPAKRSTYDRALMRGNRPDGGWIIHGGYR
jgi:hypothetical protein